MADLPEQRDRRTISLRTRLLVLVLVPLIGFSAFASILVTHRFQRVQAAEDAVRQVRAAVALDGLRARIAEEAIPLVSSIEMLDLSTPEGTTRERNDLAVSLHTLYSGATARTDATITSARQDTLARAVVDSTAGRRWDPQPAHDQQPPALRQVPLPRRRAQHGRGPPPGPRGRRGGRPADPAVRRRPAVDGAGDDRS